MTRALTSAVDAALLAGNVTAVILVELYFDSGTIYLAHAGYNISWNGNTYLGAARIGTLEPVQETSELQMNGMAGTIVANAANISIALNEPMQGRAVIMRLAAMDANHQILATPVVCFNGRMDTMAIELGDKATIRVTGESRFSDWDRPRVRRYNHEDQISKYPTDLFFQFVAQMVEKQLLWGVGSTAVAANAGWPPAP